MANDKRLAQVSGHVKIEIALSSIAIRRLESKDVSLYRKTRLEALKQEPDNYGSTYEEESAKERLAYEDYIEQQSPIHVVFGAFDGDDLIGIMAYFRDERRKLWHRGKVTQVYVAPSYRGRGVAKQMLTQLVDHAFGQDGLEILTLEVVTTNAPAIRVYESLGFRAYGTMEHYFKTDRGYFDQQFMSLRKGD